VGVQRDEVLRGVRADGEREHHAHHADGRPERLFDGPPLVGALTYPVLKSMREGYMYDLNRRYYKLRPPK
jgi:hypothetical protein